MLHHDEHVKTLVVLSPLHVIALDALLFFARISSKLYIILVVAPSHLTFYSSEFLPRFLAILLAVAKVFCWFTICSYTRHGSGLEGFGHDIEPIVVHIQLNPIMHEYEVVLSAFKNNGSAQSGFKEKA